MRDKKRVVIIGGGIAGLTAAYTLQKEVNAGNNELELHLIESQTTLGGKIQTLQEDGYTIERGPDSFLGRKKTASDIIKEIGLGSTIVSNEAGKSYVLAKNKLYLIPEGAVMGVPTQITPFALTGLFSPIGKVRAAFDFILPPTKEKGDLSLGAFFRRRVGNEVVDYLIDPLLSGIYAGDIDKMSLMATFPNFYQIEQKYGSLVRGMKKSMVRKPSPRFAKPKTGGKTGMFQTSSAGLETVVNRMESLLTDVHIQKGVKVVHIQSTEGVHTLELSNGQLLEADMLIIATPHKATYNMFQQHEPFQWFKDMPATTVANVALAFPEHAVKQELDGTGFVISRKEKTSLTACTWTHKKWPHSAPTGKALLRCYIGKPGDEDIVRRSDDEIVAYVLKELNKIMKISSPPEKVVVSRWEESMPQYTVGHLERMELVKKYCDETLQNVYLAGGSYEGLGLPDCMDQGIKAANAIIQKVKGKQRDVVEI